MVQALSPVGRILSVKNRKHTCDKGHTYFGNHCHACVQYTRQNARPLILQSPDHLLDSDYINCINYQSAMIYHAEKKIND